MSTQLSVATFRVGQVQVTPEIVGGDLRSIGDIRVGGTPLRNTAVRFLPWFDSYEGEIYRRFRFDGISQRGQATVLTTTAISDPDVLFRERRDSSGDLVFKRSCWDSEPLEATLRIVLEPADAVLDGRDFTGFRYWYEYESENLPIHRLVDRQTWEVGGTVEGVNLCLRNWSHSPLTRLGPDTEFSSGGLVQSFVTAFPGNLWGRWSMFPAFDMQYAAAGVTVAWFNEVSLIRTLMESTQREDWLRCLDMHCFSQSTMVRTNPKTVLYSPDQLDDVEALNLWTRIHDQERDKARKQFGLQEEEPPLINFHTDVWVGQDFATSYEHMLDVAEEFHGDICFIDPVWEHGEAFDRELRALVPAKEWDNTIFAKHAYQNMCCTYDFEVAKVAGGEEGLKALCGRASAKGMRIMSWMSTHFNSQRNRALNGEMGQGFGGLGVFAARESGCHPDTGYPAECWPMNLNSPITEHLKTQIIGVCQRTGLAGFLWDSFSNMGWWQVDYGSGTMRPQCDKMAQLYTDLANAGLYMQPEALVAFSSHSSLGMAGGNYYPPGIMTGYSYDITTGMGSSTPDVPGQCDEYDIITGNKPIDMLFQWVAHRHMPVVSFHLVPREQWDATNVAAVKGLFKVYKDYRHLMQRRIVLPDYVGVRWENGSDTQLLYCFADHQRPGIFTEAATGTPVPDGQLKANHVYLMQASTPIGE